MQNGLFLLFGDITAQRVGLSCNVELRVVYVRVYLRRVQVLVAQDLLHGAHIHAVLDHQGRSRVPQLVGGVFAGVKPGLQDGLFNHGV